MGSAPGVHHLWTFGCVAHVKNTTPNLKKLDDRSRRMIFIGYEPGSKAYRVYDLATQRVHISHDIIFDEAAQWSWASTHDVEPGDFTIEQENPEAPEVILTSTSTTSTPASSSTSRSPSPNLEASMTTPVSGS